MACTLVDPITAFTLSPSSRVRLGSWVLSPCVYIQPQLAEQTRLACQTRQLPTILRIKLSVWDCVRKRGTSTGSSQLIAGADSAFCLHYKKLPCQTRLAGRILPFCWGRKGESDSPRGAGDLRLHWGKKASQTRLSG